MTIIELKDGNVELDDEGFLKDFSQWSVEAAHALAEREGIELTEDHLKVIHMIFRSVPIDGLAKYFSFSLIFAGIISSM